MKVIALSFGNSRISSVILDGTRITDRCGAAVIDCGQWPALSRWLGTHGPDAVAAAVSVNPEAEKAFCNDLPIPIRVAGRDFRIPITNLTRTPETTGHDRLLTGFAASRIYKPPLIVVDFGTAFTFNVIDENGAFSGGAIAPGLGIAESILPVRCALLPEVPRPAGKVPAIGKDTEAAMQSGLYNGYLGLVKQMIEATRKELGQELSVVATGGDAAYFVSQLSPLFHDHDPDLLLKGVGLACREVLDETSHP